MNNTILVIDDNEIDLSILSSILQSHYSILTANNAQKALSILNDSSVTISGILLDIIMDKIDGFELLSIIKRNILWHNIPVIIISSLDNNESREKAQQFGADDYIIKPYKSQIVLQTLENVLKLNETLMLTKMLRRDNLTKLLTRESFFIEAEHLLRINPNIEYVVSCFDIENFKIINDQYGTDKGDAVLIHVANCINETLYQITGIACRYSGDKFAAIYPSREIDSKLIEANHRKLVKPECLNRTIKIRIGRYIVKDRNISINAMFDRASLAEHSINGCYDTFVAYYDESMRDDILYQQRIINEMENALKQKEFELWLQPQYDHVTHGIVGAEALVRWRKKGEVIPPSAFIPIFEKNGFVYEIDKFMWEEACHLIRRWLDAGKEIVPISVNVSRFDLLQEDFFSVLINIITKYKISLEYLRLEVTESAFSKLSDVIIEVIKKLVAYGFTIEIDDFGSGFSSLNTLKDVPAQVLKLDMRFLEGKDNSQRGGAIIESVVRMAHWLDMNVIAEGVETKEQADYLKSIDCVQIQGYLYSRPITISDFERLIELTPKKKNTSCFEILNSWNNKAFWDPVSMETLIFNSYVGGACIFEYSDDKIELLIVNEEYDRIFSGQFGYDVHDKFDLPDIVDEVNRKKIFENIKKALQLKSESSCEICLVSKEGLKKYIRTTVKPIAETINRYLFYCGVVDITELRLSQQNEAESLSKLQSIMDNIENGIIALILRDDNPEILFASNKYFEINGLLKNLDNSNNLNDYLAMVHKDDKQRVIEQIKNAINDMKKTAIEYRIIKSDEKIAWIKVVFTVSHIFGYEEPVLIGVFTDITNEKRTNELLLFLNSSAQNVLAISDSNTALRTMLNKAMDYLGGDCVYVYEINKKSEQFVNTYEIYANNCKPKNIVELKQIPSELTQFINEEFQKTDSLMISDINKITNVDLQEVLKAYKIFKLIIAPLRKDSKIIGFLGIDNPENEVADILNLTALAAYVAELLVRREVEMRM